jgi:DNA polymerase-3 subunit beta
MLHIPKPAGLLAKLAARETTRHSLNGIQVVANGTETRLIATDGHALGILRGPAVPPGSEACMLVPLQAWAEIFKACAKAGHVELGTEQLATGGKRQTVVPYQPVDGHFPEYMRVLPALPPLFRCCCNPRLLIRVLEVAAAISETEEGACKVELFCYSPTRPLGIAAVGADGLTFDGIIMPLT